MSLPLLIAFLAVLVFGILAISSSIREDRLRKRLSELEAAQKRKQVEEDLIAQIDDALDQTLDISGIVTLITQRIAGYLPHSTISSLRIQEHNLAFKAVAAETLSQGYIETVKDVMLQSLATLEKRSFREMSMHEDITGNITDAPNNQPIAYAFHLPIFLHNSVVALITVTSTQSHIFSHDDVAMLQRVVTVTTKQLSKLDSTQQKEKGRLDAVVGSLKEGLFVVDTNHNLQLINPAAKQMLSIHHEPVNLMDILSALPIHVDFKGKLQAALEHNTISDLPSVTLKDKLLQCTISPVQSASGEVLGALISMRDETLRNSVPRMKEDFTNILVHELRNPLTSIKASSELLNSNIKLSETEQKKLIQLISHQSNNLLSEVQQILDAAKLEAGVFALHQKKSDLKQLMKDVTEGFQKQAREKMINYIVEVDHSLPMFSFDPVYIGKVLNNLLTNSMKFTSTGGTIQVQAKQKHDSVVITIADTGAGIPKDKQHKLFNKFSQLEEASATVGKGLGLYLVKGIIEAHNGTVTIDSDQGRGTTILLTLPLTEATHTTAISDGDTAETTRMIN